MRAGGAQAGGAGVAGGVGGAAAAAAGWLGGMLRPAQPAGAALACTLDPDVLASLERRLRPLEAGAYTRSLHSST